MRRSPFPGNTLSPLGFGALKAFLIAETGLAYYQDKDAELMERVAERALALKCSDYQAYLTRLQDPRNGAAELDALMPRLTIGETYFFRYNEQFEALRTEIVPEILAHKPSDQPLRVWSAGCATGEEAYSLAILLLTHFPRLGGGLLDIMATDLNPQSLAQAASARYRKWSFRQNDPRLQAQYFDEEGSLWRLKAPYRHAVKFRPHNLIQDTPSSLSPQPFDLIVCRNVLIYFDSPTQRRLIQRFYQHLQPQGWLILGPSELTPLSCYPFGVTKLASLSCFCKGSPLEASPDLLIKPIIRPNDLSLPAPDSAAPSPGPAPPPPPVPSADLVSSGLPELPDMAALHPELRRLSDLGQLAAAEALCRELLLKESLNATLYYELALIVLAQGRFEEALGYFQRTLYLERHHSLAHYHLGLLWYRQGKPAQARRALRNAARLLQGRDDEEPLPDADGLNVGQLRALIHMHEKKGS
ncbi:MAG: CheR family methyltransferase [Candidatus Sericytochromatia bacterium]